MPEFIVDTNVPIVAQGDEHPMDLDCELACIEFIEQVLSNQHTIVIDDCFHVIREYQRKLNSKGQQKLGDRFLYWVLTNQANPSRVKQIPITQTDALGHEFAEYPASLHNINIDHSDKKFIAIAKANGQNSTIVQSSDSKWIGWIQNLFDEGILINFLCQGELEEKFKKKSKR
ncbi:MAG TPA: hypothetical protein VHE34_00820 [Puia sp.]|uniref:hypothetical protein n=1 Tax=Puia sp. TaxID=2045100 RepID=UPI002CB0213E|nr:hypothetical protein [Puia sp.]HVU93727.1 hypothetical protein [Puia sp.]